MIKQKKMVWGLGSMWARDRKGGRERVICASPFGGSSCSNRCRRGVPLGSSPAIMRYYYLTAPSWRGTDTESTV